MADYRISFANSARKELEGLAAEVVRRVFPKIEALAARPRPPGCRKLQGLKNLWRIRIGPYRVIYSIDDERRLVDIVAIRHRSKAYE